MPTNWKARGLPDDLEERHLAYRDLIVDAAEAEFARRPFSDVKINMIARISRVSDATIRRHFTGKVGIWNGMFAARGAELFEMLHERVGDQSDPTERILDGVRTVVEFFARRPGFLNLQRAIGWSWAAADRDLFARGEQLDFWSDGRRVLHAGVTAAMDAGQVRAMRPEVATALILSALQLWLVDTNDSRWPGNADAITDELCEHLCATVFARAQVLS